MRENTSKIKNTRKKKQGFVICKQYGGSVKLLFGNIIQCRCAVVLFPMTLFVKIAQQINVFDAYVCFNQLNCMIGTGVTIELLLLSSFQLSIVIQQLALSRWHLLNCFRILILNASPQLIEECSKSKRKKNIHIIDCSRERKLLKNYLYGRIVCI